MLNYHPPRGAVLICDYKGFIMPEMVKSRPVIVISPRFRTRSNLCSVVPLSTTKPEYLMDYHMEIELPARLPKPFDCKTHWVKADMINTVCFDRLSPIKLGKDQFGKRKYLNCVISNEQMEKLLIAVKNGLGIK